MKETSKIKNLQLLNAAETLSVLGAIGGAVASVVFQQVAFASIPLSAALALNLANRRQMLNTLNQTQQTAIAQLIQENLTTQNRVGKLTQELAVVQDSTILCRKIKPQSLNSSRSGMESKPNLSSTPIS